MALISQVQRSGGTLLSQLLDGHPQLHVHPSELKIGRPNKYHWPRLQLSNDPDALFDQLWESNPALHARDGYNKASNPEYAGDKFPFMFSIDLQRDLFRQFVAGRKITSQREAIDAYITSYFNAWIDYQGLYRDPSSIKYWVAFVPRLMMLPENQEGVFRDYPDGKVICIVREPISWYASAVTHNPGEYADLEHSISLWNSSARASMALAKDRPGNVMLLSFQGLLESPRNTMEQVCSFLGIEWHKTLECPTFNHMPIRANTSFRAAAAGKIITDPVKRSNRLKKMVIERLRAGTKDVYSEFRQTLRPCNWITRWFGNFRISENDKMHDQSHSSRPSDMEVNNNMKSGWREAMYNPAPVVANDEAFVMPPDKYSAFVVPPDLLKEAHHNNYGRPWALGRYQFELLLSRGLQPEHRILDLGCGAGRLAIWTIPYLDPGHYFGIDNHRPSLEALAWYEIPLHKLEARQPRLLHSGDFDLKRFGIQFDWVVDFFCTSHLKDRDQLITVFRKMCEVLGPGGRILSVPTPSVPPHELAGASGLEHVSSGEQFCPIISGHSFDPVNRWHEFRAKAT
ncbi:MAG: sulfotransferase [Nitrospirae bacterium]|nr:sulfotransferase [Nitrospirota bacterium]